MDILQALRQLRPGTAWTMHRYSDGTIEIFQAEDGTDRVLVPTMDEINAIISKYAPPPTIEDRIAKLETTLQASKNVL